MQNKEAIAALQQQIEGLRQDLALGHISKSQFGTERGKLLAQIDILDTRRSCTFPPEPTPEQTRLVVLKNRVLFAIEPYKHRVASKDYHALQIALRFCTDTRQVETLYNTWQGKLRHKNIAELPDLNAKPPQRKQTDLNQAA